MKSKFLEITHLAEKIIDQYPIIYFLDCSPERNAEVFYGLFSSHVILKDKFKDIIKYQADSKQGE